MENHSEYLQETFFLDFTAPVFTDFLKEIDGAKDKVDIALQLYYLIRDGFLYDPYHLNLTPNGLQASAVIAKKRAWCVEKATLLAACARKFEIPSRLGYAVVINHIGVEKLKHYLKRDEIVFHGFVELFLDGKWVKCTPAFDRRICRLSGVAPLNWNGKDDSLFQEYEKGEKSMEYTHFYGHFNDVPIQLMQAEMKKYYPHLFEKTHIDKDFSFIWK
jgi:transglutaminase-like putative cysteine protease